MFGDADHGNQGHDDQPQPANLVTQEGHLRPRPAEVQLGHAPWREHAVGAVEHQPGLGHFVQGGAEDVVLPARVHLQQVAAKGQEHRAGQRQQQVEQQRQRGVQLTVVAEMADFLAQRAEFGVDLLAPPEQRGDQQQQRQKEQRAFLQPGTQLLHRGQPGHRRELRLESANRTLQPVEVQRLVAGNPEHLLVEGIAECAGSVLQLLLVELQGDRGVEQ